ncbi:unnamed protein product [Leptidea sinapis]|uniref:PHD-type domain-containing protein n=1 Tax=Leptidea sinapis TaxID=189913 RepID=A0A5E4PUP9_9NEOP|nr:unnamed protein product [Leptidea sinapis]
MLVSGDEDLEEGEGQNDNSAESDEAPPKEDDDYSPEDGRKKKKGKKRKARGEDKKGRKKKKKRKNESEEVEAEGDSDYALSAVSSSKKSRKVRGAKHNTSTSVASDSGSGMPTVEEVCTSFGLADVDIQYSDADLENLTSYKLFQQHVRPFIVPVSKVMMLVAAKWRLFCETNPHLDGSNNQNIGGSEENTNTSTASDYVSSKRAGRTPKDSKVDDSVDEPEEEEDEGVSDEGVPAPRKRGRKPKHSGSTPRGKPGRKPKEEEQEGSAGANSDSDAEFEQMLAEAQAAKTAASAVEEPVPPKEEDPNAPQPPKKKAKTKIGNKSRKKKKLKTTNKFPDGTEGEPEHQDYCEVCQQGGEIILCDTCPRAYHLVCLEPELEETPEGRWSCPHCEAEGNQDQEDDDEHQEFCRMVVSCCAVIPVHQLTIASV